MIVVAVVSYLIFSQQMRSTPSTSVPGLSSRAIIAADPPQSIPEKSIAVLPFADSEKKDQEYFSDGLSEELIDLLAQVPDLCVPARTSSFFFKGKNEDIATVLGIVGRMISEFYTAPKSLCRITRLGRMGAPRPSCTGATSSVLEDAEAIYYLARSTGERTMTAISAAAPVRHPDRFFINGQWTVPSSESQFDVINCATEDLFLRVAEAQEADVNRAVAAARAAFDRGPWPRMSHTERAAYLKAIARELGPRTNDSAKIWISESGVTSGIAQMSLGAGLGRIYEYYAGLAETFAFEEQRQPSGGGNVGLLVREPVGVVAAIIPWNAPSMLIAYKIAPALLAGCTVILKASPEAPGAAYVIAEICEKIGLPPGVLNILTADRAVSELLVRHPDVDKVTFTGSTAAGKRIGSICGERIARCTLELGGKSAAVILDDYDVGIAAATISGAAGFMTGQVCSSLTRIIVTRKRHDALLEALSASFGALKVGDPCDPATQMGPLAMRRQRDRVEGYIAKGRAEGAKLATGGKRPAGLDRGFFIEPTVFGNVDNHSTIAREEIFGPVLSVIPAESEAAAVEIANDSVYGLNASVFTNDIERAYSTARQLRSGTVGHNSFRTDFSIAFGGFKQSGIGREGGTEGLLPFLETKTIILDAKPAHLTRAPK